MLYTNPLRIVSWNILGDGAKLALSTKHDYCPLHLRVWAKDIPITSSLDVGTTEPSFRNRCERTAETLLSLGADIYCLQECLPNMWDDLLAYGPLQNEFMGFHMKDHMVHSIDDFLTDERITDDCECTMDPSVFERTRTVDVDTTAKTSSATQGREEYGNAILLRRSLILDGTIQIRWVKSGLFQTIGPQLASTASSKVTGKARKRFLTLDCYGFVAMKLRIRPSSTIRRQQRQQATYIHQNESSNSNVSDWNEPMDAIIIGTHLYWNPWDPHVKALQAEVLAQICYICAEGALPPIHNPSSRLNAEEASKSTTQTSNIDINHNSTLQDKPCVVIIGGDFNSVPHFQPEFVETKEELQTLLELCARQGSRGSDTVPQISPSIEDSSTEMKIQLHDLPISFQQSGVFRLLTHGLLEPNHPEHPDTYGRGGAKALTRTKKIVLCGPMYVNPYEMPSPQGFQMAYNYPCDTRAKTDEEMHDLDNNAWPALTTKVPEFEGVIDYIFWKFHSRKYSSTDPTREQGKFFVEQTESLRVPCPKGPIPDEFHTSDHLPVGMGFSVRVCFD